MGNFESRFERLELKYLIDEATAERVRRDIEPFCQPDPHSQASQGPGGTWGYAVSSLYLDSPNLAFYRAKERGDAERIKLRIRTYGDAPFAVMELKRRVADVIDKTRATVDRKDVERVAQGWVDAPPESPDVMRFLSNFALTVARAGALPTLHLRYHREAYASVVDHYARVTFDRHIEAQRTSSWDLDPDDAGWSHFDRHWLRAETERAVVLELKCQSSIPWWVTDLVRAHALDRQSFSKYSIGIHLTGVRDGEDLMAKRSSRWMQ
jgi:SPX domain protein involved in polyphosphate accumulation